MSRRCVFFDRDGVVNRAPGAPGYVLSWEQFAFEPGFPPALEAVRKKGYEAIVVTNQRGVALGLMTEAALQDIHTRMRRVLQEVYGLTLRDVLYCPHDTDACACRKPQPGMLLEAARRYDIDLGASWMIGDSERDVEAGRAAGCRTVRICGADEKTAADVRVDRVEALQALIETVF